MRDLRIGVDVGGTFTDCVLLFQDGRKATAKVPTTPADPAQGIVGSVEAVAGVAGLDVRDLLARTEVFVHGATIATNTMVERNGARTALLTTRGHEDAIRIGRGRQRVAGLPESEITHLSRHAKPRPLVAGRHIRGLVERIDADGEIIVPLDRDEVRRVVDELLADGVVSFAVGLLWSFRNPVHENLVREVLEQAGASVYVSLSHEVAPLLGEYERVVSTVLNSYVGPRVAAYAESLEAGLTERGLVTPVLFTQASGGLANVDAVRRRPLITLDSGPAAGVLGVASLAGLIGGREILCTDVGGTTFDVGVVSNGRPELEEYPVIDQFEFRLPKIMVKSIGSGGGSIAWRDDRGALRVGPQSAGAAPGPACYGKGGTEATVTDAYLVLGYLDESIPLASGLKLDRAAAEAAIGRIADKLGWSRVDTAAGIIRISQNQMADLLHRVTMERGLDPRDFALVSYGGAGPVSAAALGAAINARSVHIMPEAGEFSALGMLSSGLVWWAQRSSPMRFPLAEENVQALNQELAELDAEVRAFFAKQGQAESDLEVGYSLDMRFAMQAHHLEVPLPEFPVPVDAGDQLQQAFKDRYVAVYGPNSIFARAEVELVNLRVVGRTKSGEIQEPAASAQHEPPTSLGTREVYYEDEGYVTTPVFKAAGLPAGSGYTGPVIIHRSGDTVVIPSNWTGRVDQSGQLILHRARGATTA